MLCIFCGASSPGLEQGYFCFLGAVLDSSARSSGVGHHFKFSVKITRFDAKRKANF